MPSTLLTSLPTELLTSILSHLPNSHLRNADIHNLRLVSHHLNAIASPFLIQQTSVSFTTSSFEELEYLANHSEFAKGVQKVEIDVTYFDAWLACKEKSSDMGDKQAEKAREEKTFINGYGEAVREPMKFGWERFVADAATNLFQQLEMMERMSGRNGKRNQHSGKNRAENEDGEGHKPRPKRKTDREYVYEADGIPNEWRKVNEPSFEKGEATEKQTLVLDAYEKYVKLFEDQERVVQMGDGIKRLVKALANFSTLREIVIQDIRRSKPSESGGNSYAERLSNEGIMKKCLSPSKWKGTFQTAMVTLPPTLWVSALFTELTKSDIRPTRFKLELTAPADLRSLRFSPQELNAVNMTLSRAGILDLIISSWSRKGSLAVNNDRPREELAGLGALSKELFRSTSLKELHMSLVDYPCFYEVPKVSLDDFLISPLSKPHLSAISFRNIPMKLCEMQSLVHSVKETVNFFLGESLYMLDSTWMEGIDVLRELKNLKYLSLKYLVGGEFGNSYKGRLPTGVMEEYVLRQRTKNPLIDWER